MQQLSKDLIKSGFKLPDDLKCGSLEEYPEKVLQFGEGNFLRGFVDWMFNGMNSKGLFKGKICVVKPISFGSLEEFEKQDGLYTLYLRGIQEGKIVENKEIITSISRAIGIYENYDEYLKCAENPDLSVIVSNTTEAGIAYNPEDKLDDMPPASFPAKLTVLLYKRYKFFNGDSSKGFIIIPCELIDRNGDNLKRIVLQYANDWKLEEGFIDWLENSNYFLNTLVDRIVTGYPREEDSKIFNGLGYKDTLLDTAEIFHLWVIEGDKSLAEKLPFDKAGFNVIWTENMEPYRTRKVRILNGAHTMTVLAAYLCGLETVKDIMDDEMISSYMNRGIFEEIIPTLDLPRSEMESFANAVSERFANPFIKHYLLSIALNSTSKFKTRVLPSITEYVKRENKLPTVLSFSMAALIAFYCGQEIKDGCLIGKRPGNEYKINDDFAVLEFFRDVWADCDGTGEGVKSLARKVLAKTDMWGMDLNEIPGFAEVVSDYLYNIREKGMREAMRSMLDGK